MTWRLTDAGQACTMWRMSTSAHTSPAAVPTWSLGWRLQRSLAYADMTTDDMAQELQVSRGTISRWINDKGTPPKRLYLQAWAARTGVDPEWIQGGSQGATNGRYVGDRFSRELLPLVA